MVVSLMLFGVTSIYVALSFDNIFESKSLLHSSNSSSSSVGSGIPSPLASILNQPSGSENALFANQMLVSRDFFEILYKSDVFASQLLAYDYYDKEQLSDNFNSSLIDIKTLKWKKNEPAIELAHRIFLSKHFLFYETSERSFFRLTIRHQSPLIAKEWNDLIIKEINNYVASYKENSAREVLSFFLPAFELEKNMLIKTGIQNLIMAKYQDIAFTKKTDYVFSIISKPFIPIKKSSPNRPLICFAITLMGFIFTLFVIIAKDIILQNRNAK